MSASIVPIIRIPRSARDRLKWIIVEMVTIPKACRLALANSNPDK